MDHRSISTWDWRRIARLASVVVLVFLAVSLGPPLLHAQVTTPLFLHFLIGLLRIAHAAYGVVLLTVPVAMIVIVIALWRARCRGVRRPGFARGFVLGVAVMFSLLMAEGVAAAWLAWTQASTTRLPTRFPDRPTRFAEVNRQDAHARELRPTRFSDISNDDTLDIVVIGGSSACGFPYHEWLSVAQIVAWKLQEALPDRRFRVEHMAGLGLTLESAHKLMSGLERRPDLVIIYSGHNEFLGRYEWNRTPLHYADDTPPAPVIPEEFAREHSPLSRLIEQTIVTYRAALPPPRHVTRPLVDVPVYTAADYAERLREFRARLEAMVSYCEQLGALVVLLPPPGNDADTEPNRSFLLPRTTRAERAEFTAEFEAARRTAKADPVKGIAAFRALLGRQPGFAEGHYRLARLLEGACQRDLAHQHYVAARDCDGYPVRCPSDFLNVYHEIAARHRRAILVDGPEVLLRLSPRGTVGDEFCTDSVHLSLTGYTALAQAILQSLYVRRSFGWPASSPAPVATPSDCAAHFAMNTEKWMSVCEYLSTTYRLSMYIRYDPSERSIKFERYRDAFRQLKNGRSPATIHLPGIETGSLPTRSEQ